MAERFIGFKCSGRECEFLMWVKESYGATWEWLVRAGLECLLREDLRILEQAIRTVDNRIAYIYRLITTAQDQHLKKQLKKKQRALKTIKEHLVEAKKRLENQQPHPCIPIYKAQNLIRKHNINIQLPNCTKQQ